MIEVEHLKTVLNNQIIHEDVSFTIKKDNIAAIIGGSGSGKTTILRVLLMLVAPAGGTVKLFGANVATASPLEKEAIRHRIGMLFQKSALFSSMTVLENVMFPILRHTELPFNFAKEIAEFKLSLVGLTKRDGIKLPSELSGGMLKRAAAARAIALDPELLLLDEPLSGLDPHSALQFDELLLFLRENLKLTIVTVTHDVTSLQRLTDQVIFLGRGRVLSSSPISQLMQSQNEDIKAYFADQMGHHDEA